MTTADSHRFVAHLTTHKGILYKVAHAYCRAPSDRDDLIQEIVAHLWTAFPRYDDAQRFSTWMYRVALNVAISFYRKEARRQRDLVPIEAASHVGALDLDPDLHRLLEHVRALPELERALTLFYLDGLSHDEIAEAMGMTATHVSTRLHRIKQKLQRCASSTSYAA